MYYIEKAVKLNTGVKYDTYSVHIITSLRIDYVNREFSASLCSYKSMAELAKNFISKDTNVEICSNYFNAQYEIKSFDIDPVLIALRILVATEDSPFFKSEIRRLYNTEEILTNLVSKSDNSKTDNENISPTVDDTYSDEIAKSISGESVIGSVTIAKVKLEDKQ